MKQTLTKGFNRPQDTPTSIISLFEVLQVALATIQ